MDIYELQSIVRRELDQALGADGSKLSAARRKSLQYYEGEPFGNELPDRSQVVMRTVLEVVEWVLPALLRIFTASDKIADIDPTRPDQEAGSQQATDYISYIFYKDNPGFLILHDWFKDALIQKVGWLKCFWDTQKVEEVNSYTGLTEQEYAALKTPDATVMDERSYPAPVDLFAYDAPDPQAQPAMLYDCTIRVVRQEGRVKIAPVPPEEVLTSRRAKALDSSLPFVSHQREWTYTDLVEQGYDEDVLEQVVGQDGPQYNTEKIVRYESDDDFPFTTERTDAAMRPIWTEENYIRVDWNGDGIAELNKIVTAGQGKVILTRNGKPDIEEIDEIPLIPITPLPMPHKLVGMSVADLVMDLQLIKSTLIRQSLDGGYLALAPRTIVGQGAVNENTYDDLLTVRPGGIIRANDAAQIVPIQTNFRIDAMLPLVEYVDQTAEIRTGISRQNQGLNPDDLNKTAMGINLVQQAAAQRVELIARIFAETGVKVLVQRILGLITRFQQHERIIRLTGKWVPMDPRQWRNSMDVSVSVGLGTGNRDQILQHLMQILTTQQNILMGVAKAGPAAAGFASLVSPKNVYDVLSRLTENAGFKEEFFTDPAQAQQQPGGGMPQQPPNPQLMKAQQEMQMNAQESQQDMEVQRARAQADLQVQQAKLQAEQQQARERAVFEMQLEELKARHAMQLEVQREQAKQELARYEIDARARAGAYTPGPPPNGAASP